jgi:predicted CopG family antitoxin
MEKTTVQVSKATLKRLQTFKQHQRESYDDILNQLMDSRREQASKAGTAAGLLKFAGMLSDERAREFEQSIKEGRERSRKRYA